MTTYLVGVTDPNATWHSIDDVNNFAASTGFTAGDQILFESGQTFAGSLSLQSSDQHVNMGTPSAPITIGSYDPNAPGNPLPPPATIASGAGVGIQVYNAAGFHITDLNIQGGWSHTTRSGNNSDGIIFDGNLGTGVVLSYVHIDHVTVSGYGSDVFDFNRGNGILFGSVDGVPVAYNDVAVTDSVTHEDVSNGIYSRAFITNLLLDHDKIYDVYGLPLVNSGYGIHMWNINGGVVQRCEVFNTGVWGGDPYPGGPDGSGGPVAIDVSHASHVLFQYNDAHNNHDYTGYDGDGFDFDEHTTDSIMQYNYSHDNDGVGYLLGTWLSDGFNTRNVLRYNVSENDCRRWNYGAILLESPLVTDCDIYNNTVYVSPNLGHNDNILSAIEIPVAGQAVRVRSNVFQTSGGVPAVVVQNAAGSGVLFQGNDYNARGWVPSATQPLVIWGSSRLNSLDQWRVATQYSQEYLTGRPLGTQEDPLLANPGVSGVIDNPFDPNYVPNHIDQLGRTLAKYYGSTNSVAGLDLTRLGNVQWDPSAMESQGGYLTAYWVPTQDFAGHTFTWGGPDDPHTPGAFQFTLQFAMTLPSTTASSMPFSLTIQALDEAGNVNTAYTGTIHFATTDSDGGVVLPGDYTFTAADAGQHTFDGVTLITTGEQAIVAIDPSTGIMAFATITVLGGDAPPGGAGRRLGETPMSLPPAAAAVASARLPGDGSPTLLATTPASVSKVAPIRSPSPAGALTPTLTDLPASNGDGALAPADVVRLFNFLHEQEQSLGSLLTWEGAGLVIN